jgi:hypothetical protein
MGVSQRSLRIRWGPGREFSPLLVSSPTMEKHHAEIWWGKLLEYHTLCGIPRASIGPGKSRGESSSHRERTHIRIRSPRCVASSVLE